MDYKGKGKGPFFQGILSCEKKMNAYYGYKLEFI